MTEPGSGGADRRRDLVAIGGILLLGAFAYSNALRGAFVFDDLRQIANNPTLRDLGAYFSSLRGCRETPNRCVAYATFALNYRLGGLEPAGYHAVNVAIHLANALLVYALVRLAFASRRLRGSSLLPQARAIAFVAAAAFATHPLQTQAVTYVVQRLTALASLFYLGALVLYARWREGRGRALPYLLALCSTLLAMKTKEIAFTLPLALALWEVAFGEGDWRRRGLALAPFLLAMAVIPLTLVNVGQPLGKALADATEATRVQTAVSRLDYFRTQLAVVATYLRLLVYPAGQNIDHDFPIYRSLLAPRVALSTVLLLSLLILAVYLLHRSSQRRGERAFDPAARLASFGIGWFFLALAVESSVIPIVDVLYEHRAYLPSVGFFLALAVAWAWLMKRFAGTNPGRATALGGLLAGLLLASLSLQRNVVWRDEVSLWSDAAAKSPGKSRPHANLGTALSAQGRVEEGARELRLAVGAEPSSAYARAQLGAALLTLGRTEEGESELREADRLKPDDPETLFNLGIVLWRTGRTQEASQRFRRFLDVAPASYASARRVAAARVQP